MNDVPEFKGNVKAFRIDVLVDKAAEELYPTWQKDIENGNSPAAIVPTITSAARSGSTASATRWARR